MWALAACTRVGPDYQQPEPPVTTAWQVPPGANFAEHQDDLVSWWEAFDDPVLTRLVEHTYQRNYSLEIAGLRVLEARAQLAIAVGSAYPQSQIAGGGVTWIRASRAGANTAGGDLDFRQYDVAGDVFWELDFWGRFARGIESADAAFLASIANYHDALVLLTSQVADTYAVVRTLEERLRISEENLVLQQRSYDITEVKFRNGQDSELDVQQALTLLLSTEATVPALQAQLVQARNALATLLSVSTHEVGGLIGEAATGIPTLPENVAVGVPADLLRRRPDVRAAELVAMSQSSLIGVAQADLFPSFALAGTVGLSAAGSTSTTRSGSSGVGELFSGDGVSYAAGPQFSWNLFNYGRIKNNVRVQDARLQQLLVSYQDTVLRAAQEVEDAMVGYLNARAQSEILARGVDAARRASDLSVVRYQEGFSDYQRVLDSQQSLFGQQQRYVDAQGNAVRSLIALYKALGGGWELRARAGFVDVETLQQMRERTDWGELLEPEATDPAVTEPDRTFRKPDW